MGKQEMGKGLSLALITWVLVVVVSPIVGVLVEKKEHRYSSFVGVEKQDDSFYHILILGGGKTSDPKVPSTTQLNRSVSKRLIEGIRIYQLMDSSLFIGSSAHFDSNIAQGATIVQAALELGVAQTDTAYIIRGTNTLSEAQDYVMRFGIDNKLILVTSAIHMPRAVAIFESFGVKVIPAPTDYMSLEDPSNPKSKWRWDWGRVDRLGRWLHEVVGMWYFEVVQR